MVFTKQENLILTNHILPVLSGLRAKIYMKQKESISEKEFENALKAGGKFIFDNEIFQNEIKKDDIRSAEVYFNGTKFFVWFNGKLIHSSKTFKSLSRRLNLLKLDWNLRLTQTN